MYGIIAVNKKGFIGLNGHLPWKSINDLKHFKKLTTTSNKNEIPKLLVGYNTLKTLPILSGRELIVASDELTLSELMDIDWCIGGMKTYEKYCEYFTELHISHINDDTEGDTKYPLLGRLNPDCLIYEYDF